MVKRVALVTIKAAWAVATVVAVAYLAYLAFVLLVFGYEELAGLIIIALVATIHSFVVTIKSI